MTAQGSIWNVRQAVGQRSLLAHSCRSHGIITRREYLRGGDTASTWSGAGSTAMVSPLGMNGADWPVAVPCAGLRVDHERRSHAPPACRCDDVGVWLVV